MAEYFSLTYFWVILYKEYYTLVIYSLLTCIYSIYEAYGNNDYYQSWVTFQRKFTWSSCLGTIHFRDVPNGNEIFSHCIIENEVDFFN
jgi:hypothetical protein